MYSGNVIILISIYSILINTYMYCNQQQVHYQLAVWGYYTHAEGHDRVAYDCFEQLLAVEQLAPTFYYGYIDFLTHIGAYAKIAALVPYLQKNCGHNAHVNLRGAQALERTGKIQEAYEYLIALSEQFTKNAEIIYHTARAHQAHGNIQKALDLVQKFQQTGINTTSCLFYYLEAQLYLELEDYTQALAIITRCLNVCPTFDKAWLLWAVLQEQEQNWQQALEGYTKFFLHGGNDPDTELQLMRLIKLQYRSTSNEQIAHFYYQRAHMRYAKSEYADSLQDIRKALTLFPINSMYQALEDKLITILQNKS